VVNTDVLAPEVFAQGANISALLLGSSRYPAEEPCMIERQQQSAEPRVKFADAGSQHEPVTLDAVQRT
jgi:hypothetical protein